MADAIFDACFHFRVIIDNKAMSKAVVLLLLVLVGTTYGSLSYEPQLNVFHRFGDDQVKLDLCPECINEAVTLINVVLNIILDEGIVASCGALCEAVYNRTSSKVLADLCDVGCEGVGIDEFIKIIIRADIDPIYYCQLVDMCPINDHGDAKFVNFCVFPATGPEGTTFLIDLSFKTVNGTGTGTFTFTVTDPKNQSSGDLYWFEEKKPGTYVERIQFATLTIPNCDPSDEACVDAWPLGTYNVTGEICNGDCGSHHPHTSVYDAAASSFVLTKKP